MNNTAQKLFAFYISSDTKETLVALQKLAAYHVTLEDVAENLGGHKWRTRHGNIEFEILPTPQETEQQQRLEAKLKKSQQQEQEEQIQLRCEHMLKLQERKKIIDRIHAKQVRRKQQEQEERKRQQRERDEFEARMKAPNPLRKSHQQHERDLDKLGGWFGL